MILIQMTRWNGNLEEIFLDYFDRVKSAIYSGIFDIIAHIDLIKLWGIPLPKYIEEVYLDVSRIISGSKVAVEINTSGLRRPVKEIYPSPRFLETLAKFNIPITFGSDAHLPEDAGRSIEDACHLAITLGFKDIAIFENRQVKFITTCK
ncbi:MAG TPA: hypothetical protein PLK33_06610 [bacterium]|nr:hypothetical protein [bacterium]